MLDWLLEDFTNGYDRLPFKWKQLTNLKFKDTANKGVVCISGKLKSYKTKAVAKTLLEKEGYVVKSSLTKDVTILINESGIESAKTRTARDKGITIIQNLKDLI